MCSVTSWKERRWVGRGNDPCAKDKLVLATLAWVLHCVRDCWKTEFLAAVFFFFFSFRRLKFAARSINATLATSSVVHAPCILSLLSLWEEIDVHKRTEADSQKECAYSTAKARKPRGNSNMLLWPLYLEFPNQRYPWLTRVLSEAFRPKVLVSNGWLAGLQRP